MKKFIRYLYEYQNGQKVQNVGFVKVEHSDDCEVIQIYGKGFPAAGNQELEVLLFYMMGNVPVGISMGKIKSTRPMFGYRLEYTPEDMGGREIYDAIDGIILLNDINGFRKWYAAVWNDASIPVEQMLRREEILRRDQGDDSHRETVDAVCSEPATRVPEDSVRSAPVTVLPEDAMRRDPVTGMPEDVMRRDPATEMPEDVMRRDPATGMPESAMSRQTETVLAGEYVQREAANSAPEENLGTQMDNEISEECVRPEADSAVQEGIGEDGTSDYREEAVTEEEREFTTLYKITRKDLAKLPRREWKLANNNFLLHGYYNYHHLISFEKDNCCWLGVPGIYHPKEQRAADAFGFGQFMKPDEGEIELSDDERNGDGDFGYWCRKVGAVIR